MHAGLHMDNTVKHDILYNSHKATSFFKKEATFKCVVLVLFAIPGLFGH